MKKTLNNLWHRLHLVSPVFFVAVLALLLTGCEQTQFTQQQISDFEAYQKKQAEEFASKVNTVTQTTEAATTAAAPLVAMTGNPGAAAALPLASNAVELLGGSALALFGIWQRMQAAKYKRSAQTMIQAVEASQTMIGSPLIKSEVTKRALKNGTSGTIHKLVTEST